MGPHSANPAEWEKSAINQIKKISDGGQRSFPAPQVRRTSVGSQVVKRFPHGEASQSSVIGQGGPCPRKFYSWLFCVDYTAFR